MCIYLSNIIIHRVKQFNVQQFLPLLITVFWMVAPQTGKSAQNMTLDGCELKKKKNSPAFILLQDKRKWTTLKLQKRSHLIKISSAVTISNQFQKLILLFRETSLYMPLNRCRFVSVRVFWEWHHKKYVKKKPTGWSVTLHRSSWNRT